MMGMTGLKQHSNILLFRALASQSYAAPADIQSTLGFYWTLPIDFICKRRQVKEKNLSVQAAGGQASVEAMTNGWDCDIVFAVL
jgi:hypothetical protein